jgi:hypothetical protein
MKSKVNIADITDHMSKIINGLLVKLSPWAKKFHE